MLRSNPHFLEFCWWCYYRCWFTPTLKGNWSPGPRCWNFAKSIIKVVNGQGTHSVYSPTTFKCTTFKPWFGQSISKVLQLLDIRPMWRVCWTFGFTQLWAVFLFVDLLRFWTTSSKINFQQFFTCQSISELQVNHNPIGKQHCPMWTWLFPWLICYSINHATFVS
jgi:hypothetical protein